jgi:hypothetical protein
LRRLIRDRREAHCHRGSAAAVESERGKEMRRHGFSLCGLKVLGLGVIWRPGILSTTIFKKCTKTIRSLELRKVLS